MPRAPKKGKKRSTAAEDLEDDSELMSPMDAESDIMQIDNNNNNNNKEGGGEDEEEDDDNFIMGSADAKGKAPVQVEEAQLENGKTLVEFLEKLDDYQPIIPDAVLEHYFTKSGFDCPDMRIKRFLALAAQKFISDVAQDAYQYCKIRQQGMSAKDKKAASKKTVLTVEDLSSALGEYGVNTKRPDYYT